MGSGGVRVWRDAGQVTPFPSDLSPYSPTVPRDGGGKQPRGQGCSWEPFPRGWSPVARLSYLHAILSHGGRSTPGRAWVRASQAWVASAQLRLPRAPLSVSFLREAEDPEETPPRPCGHASVCAPCSAPGWCSQASARASPRPAQQRGRAGDAARGLCSRSHVPTLRGVRVFTSPVGAEPHRSSVLPRCSSYAEPEASSDPRGPLLCSAVLTLMASLSLVPLIPASVSSSVKWS